MRRLVARWGAVPLREMTKHGATLAAVPDPHGQFPGVPISWYVNDTVPDVTIPEQPAGVPPWHPEGR
ncbi:MAG: hypothetical protein WBA97_36910 [Actinophytocola sp.]|uniref:hypothetical protein n=1 Tax=Actinophytocola sp. TaxID=1872138 RepID=UPI003C77AE0C